MIIGGQQLAVVAAADAPSSSSSLPTPTTVQFLDAATFNLELFRLATARDQRLAVMIDPKKKREGWTSSTCYWNSPEAIEFRQQMMDKHDTSSSEWKKMMEYGITAYGCGRISMPHGHPWPSSLQQPVIKDVLPNTHYNSEVCRLAAAHTAREAYRQSKDPNKSLAPVFSQDLHHRDELAEGWRIRGVKTGWVEKNLARAVALFNQNVIGPLHVSKPWPGMNGDYCWWILSVYTIH